MMSSLFKFGVVAVVAVVLMAAPSAFAQECQSFAQIYDDGADLCNTMWDDNFYYEEDEERAYTMWFFDEVNPNDKVTETLVADGLFETPVPVDQCHLEYYHKGEDDPLDNTDHPDYQPEHFQECHPWSENSCCHADTVETAQILKEGYGEAYHWDRCGTLSPACERFFVQEACFYECEPNAGLFRRYPGSPSVANPNNGTVYDPKCDNYSDEFDETLDCDHNSWEVFQVPIKASYCNAWYRACADDMFCAADGGSYWSCAAVYEEEDAETTVVTVVETEDAPMVGYIILGLVVVMVVMCMLYMCYMEKSGKPMFGELVEQGNGPEKVVLTT